MLNIAAFVGRLTADPELRHTSSGIPVTHFSIAVTRSYVKQGEERQTDFFDVVVWRSTAEFVCKYFKKGNLIAVEGTIHTRTYQGNDGIKRKVFELVASNVHFTESKGMSTQTDENRNFYENSSGYSSGDDSDFSKENVSDDDDLPF
ncbi:MAG: single-stranded DNA-binding protein [Firmicutes bacterium]|nr:single-stranded DNA-binding protein [Bacillota bacterium]